MFLRSPTRSPASKGSYKYKKKREIFPITYLTNYTIRLVFDV